MFKLDIARHSNYYLVMAETGAKLVVAMLMLGCVHTY